MNSGAIPDGPVRPAAWHWRSAHLLLVAAVGLLVYADTFDVPFIFDDHSSIVHNAVIQNLDTFWADGAGYRYNPRRFVGYLSFALNYHFGGLNVFGYHLVNLSVHLGSACLLYALCLLLFRTPYLRTSGLAGRSRLVALAAALLFVAHPVQTQAVTYLVQRFASMAAFFYLLCLVLYLRGRLCQEADGKLLSPKAGLYALGALAAALAAMKTKEIAFTLPLVVMLLEFSLFAASARKKWLFLLPVALTLAVVPLGMIGADRPLGELLSDVNEMTRETSDISRGSYLITQFSVVATYLRLLVLPVNQNVDYDFPIRTDLFAPSSIFSLLLLCALLGAALYLVGFRRKAAGSYPLGDPASRLVGVGILWFFVALSVESSVIPISDVIFEHRVYLPSAGAFLALAVGAALALRRFPARYFALLAAAATAAFGVATWNRNLVWADEVALWSDCVAKSPMNGRAYSNLGKALMAQGRYDEAIARLETAGRLSLNNVVSLNNLGSVYSRKGMVEKAIAVYRRAVEADPSYPMAHSNLGAELKKVGRADEAIAEFRKAIRLLPTYVDAYVNLGGALDLKGQSEAAARQFEKALQLNPRSPEAHSNLGVLDDRQGRLDEAIAHFQAALRDRPDYPEARANLGVSYHKQKRYDEAIEVYLQALALDPDSALFHSNLGITYLAQGRYDEAADRFRAAMKLAPDDPNYRNYLAAALKRQRARR